ncbi:MAG TPA: SIR2 family protein [Pyrinomonadaceae bacterium]|nr:SIR2 family protein [Pyrinomonadaceae bacterium]
MNIPRELVEQIVANNGIVFAGAGLSQGSGLPGWTTLLGQMIDWGQEQGIALADRDELEGYIANGDLLLVAEELRERFGRTDFHRFMLDTFTPLKCTPTDTHRILPKIPFAAALTSNYDSLLESAYTLEQGSSPRTFTYAEYPELSMMLRRNDFYLLKVHGTIDRIQSIVLGTLDYREIVYSNQAYRQHLAALFSTRTILFLGFSLTDPDLLLFLDNLRASFKGYTPNHFALIDASAVPAIKQRRFQMDYGIRMVPYLPSSSSHPEVYEFLQELATQTTSIRAKTTHRVASLPPLQDLGNEVSTWLQVIRYKVEPAKSLNEHTLRFVASLDEGIVKQKILVHCVGGEINVRDVELLKQNLQLDMPQGLLISDRRVSPTAIELVAKEGSLRVFTLSDFLEQMIWGSYFNILRSQIERAKILERYVDLACYKQESKSADVEGAQAHYASLETYMDAWLTERGKMHISVLGEFGTGKTWFCRHYAHRRLQRYLENPANERLPLLITLRAFTKATTAQQLVNDALLEQYKLPLVGSAYEVFCEMNRRGKLLLILDGFDEMARQVDYQTVVDNFWELAELVEENSKVILTSRTEYFRGAEESKKILGGEEFGRRTKELKPPKFEVLYIQALNDSQIRDLISRRVGNDKGAEVATRILGNKNLAEMARKPILVELLLAALDEVSADVLENQAQVYLYATDKLLMRNITAEKTFTSTADKLFFLCELAWEMINSNELRIHYTSIPDRIKSYFGDQIKDQHELDTWDFDLRNQTLLHRDIAGYYEFAHKSLAEYFVAFKFAAEMGCIASAFVQTYKESGGSASQVPYEPRTIEELADTMGKRRLCDEQMQAVCYLLNGILAKNADKTLWGFVHKTTSKVLETVRHVGTNAAILLNLRGASFAEKQLANTVLSGVELSDADLRKVNLSNADLGGAVFTSCDLSQANLSGANLTGSQLIRSNVSNADLQRSDVSNAHIIDTSLLHVDLRNANLSGIDVPNPMVQRVRWSHAGDNLITGANDGGVRIWDTKTWALKTVLHRPGAPVSEIAVSRDGNRLAWVHGGKRVGIIFYDPSKTGTDLKSLQTQNATANHLYFSASGNFLSTSHGSSGKLSVWEWETQKKMSSFEAQKGWCNAALFLKDERMLLSTGYGGEIKCWSWESAKLSLSFMVDRAGNL